MQNFKKIMLKNLCSAVIFFTYLFIMPSVWMAEGADVPPQVFVGDAPTAISIQRGEPVEMPIFFVGGTCVDKEVELYVFRIEDGRYVCFGPEGWESDYAIALEDFKPLFNVPGLPEYFLLRWQAFEDSQLLSDFDLWVCVDDQVDGIPTENSVYCGHQSIVIEEGDSGTGTGDDNGTGTGDDSGSGGDDDSGSGDDSGGFQLPTPPPFPGFGDDSSSSCQSLKYTPEGTTFSYSSIAESLELGASERITLLTSACGNSVTVSSVYKASGGEWLSVSPGGGSKIILNLNAGATGLQAGSTYTGIVTVAAGGITKNMDVTLRVLGECNVTSASVSPTSLSFQTHVGQNPSAQTLRVKDNCGHAVSATILSKPGWVTLNETSTGVFSVSCAVSGLSLGSYSGIITLRDDEYSQQHSVSVTLEVTETSSPPPDDSVMTVASGHKGYYDVGAGQTRYFKFVAGVSDCHRPIQVSNTPGSSDQPCTVHLLIKRGSKPTKADFEKTWKMSQSDYDCDLEQWIPAKPGAEDLYWKYNTGSQAELVKVKETMESNTFYFMLYNNGTKNVYDQYITVHYYD
jgi:hypothetical protein